MKIAYMELKIAIRNSLVSSIEPPSRGTTRFISLRLQLRQVQLSICARRFVLLQRKDEFCKELEVITKRDTYRGASLVAGDFNARVGADHDSWSRSIGRFGVGGLSENGQNTFRAMFIPRYVCNKYILPHQACPPSILETPMIVSLAPSESRDHSKITAE